MDSDSTPTSSASELIGSARKTRAAARELAGSSVQMRGRAQEAVARAAATVARLNRRQSERDCYLARKERERTQPPGRSASGFRAARRSPRYRRAGELANWSANGRRGCRRGSANWRTDRDPADCLVFHCVELAEPV